VLLGRLRVRGKLTLLVLLPLAAVLLTAIPLTGARLGAVGKANRTADTVSGAVTVGTLIQQLQQERLLLLGYQAGQEERGDLVVRAAAVRDAAVAVRDGNGSAQLLAAAGTVGDLEFVRRGVLGSAKPVDPGTVFSAYGTVIELLIDSLGLNTDADTSTRVGREELALDALIRHDEAISAAGAAMLVGLARPGGRVDADVVSLVAAAVGAQSEQERLFLGLAAPSAIGLYREVQEGPASQTVQQLLSRVTGDPTGAIGDPVDQNLLPSVESLTGLGRLVQIKVGRDVAAEAASVARTAAVVAAIVIVGALLLFGLVVLLSVLMAGAIANPLRRLTESAEAVATVASDELVRVADEEDLGVAVPHLVPVAVDSTDEVGDLARAFNKVQDVAGSLVERQLISRRNVATMFGNVGRRTQNLVGRQLAMIDGLERNEQDPIVLERLYRLDHVSTRLRRNANSLVVLSGAAEQSMVSEPLSIGDAIRSALGEIEGFLRVRLREADEVQLAPDVATDTILLLAELLENSTSFSPPHTEVDVTAHAVAGGCRVTIVDHGIGMTEAQLAEENARLVQRERLDLAPTDVLGLFVVGRLARRHRIDVTLRPTAGTGVTAEVFVPARLLIGGQPRPEWATAPAAGWAAGAATAPEPDPFTLLAGALPADYATPAPPEPGSYPPGDPYAEPAGSAAPGEYAPPDGLVPRVPRAYVRPGGATPATEPGGPAAPSPWGGYPQADGPAVAEDGPGYEPRGGDERYGGPGSDDAVRAWQQEQPGAAAEEPAFEALAGEPYESPETEPYESATGEYEAVLDRSESFAGAAGPDGAPADGGPGVDGAPADGGPGVDGAPADGGPGVDGAAEAGPAVRPMDFDLRPAALVGRSDITGPAKPAPQRPVFDEPAVPEAAAPEPAAAEPAAPEPAAPEPAAPEPSAAGWQPSVEEPIAREFPRRRVVPPVEPETLRSRPSGPRSPFRPLDDAAVPVEDVVYLPPESDRTMPGIRRPGGLGSVDQPSIGGRVIRDAAARAAERRDEHDWGQDAGPRPGAGGPSRSDAGADSSATGTFTSRPYVTGPGPDAARGFDPAAGDPATATGRFTSRPYVTAAAPDAAAPGVDPAAGDPAGPAVDEPVADVPVGEMDPPRPAAEVDVPTAAEAAGLRRRGRRAPEEGEPTGVARRVPGAQLPDTGPPAQVAWGARETPEAARRAVQDFESGVDRAAQVAAANAPANRSVAPAEDPDSPLLDRWERLHRRVPGFDGPAAQAPDRRRRPDQPPDAYTEFTQPEPPPTGAPRDLVDEFEAGVQRALDKLAAVTAKHAGRQGEPPFPVPTEDRTASPLPTEDRPAALRSVPSTSDTPGPETLSTPDPTADAPAVTSAGPQPVATTASPADTAPDLADEQAREAVTRLPAGIDAAATGTSARSTEVDAAATGTTAFSSGTDAAAARSTEVDAAATGTTAFSSGTDAAAARSTEVDAAATAVGAGATGVRAESGGAGSQAGEVSAGRGADVAPPTEIPAAAEREAASPAAEADATAVSGPAADAPAAESAAPGHAAGVALPPLKRRKPRQPAEPAAATEGEPADRPASPRRRTPAEPAAQDRNGHPADQAPAAAAELGIRLNRRVPGAQLPSTPNRRSTDGETAAGHALDPAAARALVEEFEAGVARAMGPGTDRADRAPRTSEGDAR
jgi:signal transduction histidine kinase